jgi:hypothetical protein
MINLFAQEGKRTGCKVLVFRDKSATDPKICKVELAHVPAKWIRFADQGR